MVGFRPNLHLEVVRTTNEPQKRQQLTRLLDQVDGTGLVYAATIRQVDLLHDLLTEMGFRVAKDHARMSSRQRKEGLEAFMVGTLDALVATGAFGASVTKRDLRFVIHYSTPGSLREYHQEITVAGRGGEAVRCVLLFQAEEGMYFGGGRYPTREEIRAVHDALARLGAAAVPVTLTPLNDAVSMAPADTRVVIALLKTLGVIKEYRGSKVLLQQPELTPLALDEMAADFMNRHAADHHDVEQLMEYGRTNRCRWKVLLEFLDEEADWGHCGTCDNCRAGRVEQVASAAGQTEARNHRGS